MKKPLSDNRDVREQLCDVLFHPPTTMTSKARRAELMRTITAWCNQHPDGVIVNKHYCANLHKDKDLQWLVKHNKISTHRVHSKHHARFAETYLRVV